MPDGGRDANHVNQEYPPHAKLAGDNAEGLFRTVRDRNSVKSGNHTEPEIQHVEKDKEEQNYAGDSLNEVKPISRIRIGQIIGPCFYRDHQTIDGVIDERYKDPGCFDENNVRNCLEIRDRFVEMVRARQRL